ncbi:type II secretion system F family protein [Aeoliella mucimassa]|uniref:Bacterial type II secretion system protein F domain protein n=1 Tax=Aeoliella mucimassa TaxID=2527972 RepID=A0A518AJI9_9BACT|nr:type II secretion system F family protein [Aeoliella mucimassa]QDU54907.1 Bacterial type II secretion system protein F domain protein [Aeoliella mucimassa]
MAAWIIYLCVFAGVAALVAGVAAVRTGDREDEVAQRLSALTIGAKDDPKEVSLSSEIFNAGRDGAEGAFERIVSRYMNLNLLFEQADVNMTVSKFLSIVGGAGVLGFVLPTLAGMPMKFAPIVSVMLVTLPFLWLIMKRKRRLNKFAAQLPEALELISRALRAGHSLAAGFNLVGQEMSAPISTEFNRTFEEQNLGMPLEEALNSLTDRIPNLDLKFFATAVILQRQTGGDLAEILDKIGHLIRERFKIWGQVQALTGEGRLSGIVLLALPPALFVTVYRMNPDYLMLLFTDDLGKKMLVGGLVMQLLGAIVIQKIVNIKV